MSLFDDEHGMRRALDLAERGRGAVEPNPLVGAVVVRDGAVVGEGWHERFGGPHAEVVALAAAGDRARGGTLYVTLEPCCHHGKTPPCTDAIIRAGIRRVIAAISDPYPEVAGRGFAALRAAGIEVVADLLAGEARLLNWPYLTLLGLKRPYIHAKWAMTLDGRITDPGGDRWISGEESRRRVHELRGRMDAIVVGSGTVRADDPLLTARPPGPRVPSRIVLSSSGELPPECKLVQSIAAAPVIVATAPGRGEPARRLGCDVIELPETNGMPGVTALVAELGRRRMTNILVEGGAAVFGSFFAAELVDELHVFIAPRIAGGADGISPVRAVHRFGPCHRPIVRWWTGHCAGDLYLRAQFLFESNWTAASVDEPA